MRAAKVMEWVAVFAMIAGWRPASAEHAEDVWIGVTCGGTPRLALSTLGLVPEEHLQTLDPVGGVLQGWAGDEPGFDAVTTNGPGGVCRLQPGADIWLVVVWVDPPLRLIDGALQVLDQPGEDTCLGDHTLHTHGTWHVKNPDPQYDPLQCVWHATFVLQDRGSTGYTQSEPFALGFTNVAQRLDEGPPIPPATGDFDEDSTVDLDDYATFAECTNGPDVRPDPDDPAVCTCEVECINAFDFDNDLDVDLRDFAELQARWDG